MTHYFGDYERISAGVGEACPERVPQVVKAEVTEIGVSAGGSEALFNIAQCSPSSLVLENHVAGSLDVTLTQC